MKDLSFYEQAGLVLPGSIFLFGVLALFPEIRPLLVGQGITVGGLGVFLLLAYALGHLVAGAGNLMEALVWWPVGGMPTAWVRDEKRVRLLCADQHDDLCSRVNTRLGRSFSTLRGIPRAQWKSEFGLIYRDALSSGFAGRLDTFNGNYGLNRGLAASLLLLIPICIYKFPSDWHIYVLMLSVGFVVYLIRMIRFGMYFAREVYRIFILLPSSRQ